MDGDFSLAKPLNGKKQARSTIQTYSLEDFNKIRQTMSIKIPTNIIEKIKYMYNKTRESKSDYQKTINNHTNVGGMSRDNFNVSSNTHYDNRDRQHRDKPKDQELNDADWEAMRNFKATHKAKKEGISKKLDDIRSLLNKITDKTYDEMSSEIYSIIKESVKSDNNEFTDYIDVFHFVFNIVSSNAFYSKLYARFIKDFITIDTMYQQWFIDNNKVLFQLVESVAIHSNDIRIGDSEKDYNEFCKINKENESRRNLCTFFCQLNSIGVFDNMPEFDEKVYLYKYFTLFYDYGENEDMREQCAESCELFCILYTELVSQWLDYSKLDNLTLIHNKISLPILELTRLTKTQMKKDYPAITNKTLFKLMDIKLNIV